MARRERVVDAETVQVVARYAGLELPEDRVEMHVDLLNRIMLPEVRAWEHETLGFRFDDGRYSFVRPTVVHRIPWERGTRPRRTGAESSRQDGGA